MVTIRLHNTMSRTKEVFDPIDPRNVRMYVCGPTVYDRAHLGNARPVVVFDVLYRLLRHVYGADHVTYVRNFTDVDDKINATARGRKAAGDPRSLEALIRERTEQTIGWYHADMDALGALRPNQEPRATDYIEAMKDMITILIDKGNAYVVRDKSNNPPADFVLFNTESNEQAHALFSVDSFEEYGALSGRSVEDMIVGARAEKAPFKRNPADFVLWKPSDADLPGWDSPWGRGRPGWHIECSAMSYELLGGSFDIHGGGLDLQFPHHENELAQSACAHPDEGFAKVWMHNEMLQVEGKKMSKSLGNFFTVRDLLDQGIVGEVIRFVFLKSHYRKPIDWTESERDVALHHLNKWSQIKRHRLSNPEQIFDGSLVDTDIIEALSDDLNTSEAMSRLFRLADRVSSTSNSKLDSEETLVFFHSLAFMGFNDLNTQRLLIHSAVERAKVQVDLLSLAEQLQALWSAAIVSKDFRATDRLKSAIQAADVEVRISKKTVELVPGPNFDPAKLEGLK